MIDFILNRLDLLIYAIVLVAIYVVLLWLWRKVASLETSMTRLDKTLANIQVEKYENIPKATSSCAQPQPAFYPPPSASQSLKEIVEEGPEDREDPDNNVIIDVEENMDDPGMDKGDGDEDREEGLSTNVVSKTKLQKMNVDDVKKVAKAKGIDNTNGTKAELINKILSIS